MPTGGDELVAALERAGVDVVFGLPGVHNLPAWEALRTSPIRLIGVRHEQTAVYAADGYARATGKVGVALVTTGPGAANTLGAVGEAWASHSPIVVIATDIPSSLRRDGVYRGVLHETTDQAALFAPVTKLRTRDLAEALTIVRRAPTGPAYFEVPTDALTQPAAPIEVSSWSGYAPIGPPDIAALGERPLIWV